jgi:hypothetical protein
MAGSYHVIRPRGFRRDPRIVLPNLQDSCFISDLTDETRRDVLEASRIEEIEQIEQFSKVVIERCTSQQDSMNGV